MALSDLNLPAGKIIVMASGSAANVVSAGVALNFGSVQKINELTDNFVVGQSVMFNVNDGTPFSIISGTKFYLIDEKDAFFTETDLP